MKNVFNIICICIVSFAHTLSVNSQPANDNCINATLLTVDALPICGQTTAAATTQGGETKPCGSVGAQTVWYKFIATQPIMDVWVDNSVTGGCHLASGVWNSGACLPGASLSCKGAAAPIDIWHHLAGLTVGSTYLISIDYNNGGACNAGQTFCISVVAPPQTPGYNASTAGIINTYVGTCMVNTCSGQYYDDGGPAGNYSLNIGPPFVGPVYRVFCPNTVGNCLRATVNYCDMEQGFDFLRIRNGDTQNSTILATLGMAGNAIYTSTDPSGCLTFDVWSDGSNVRAGFNITLSCVPCAGGPNGTDNNDCSNAIQVCTNSNIVGASTGPGLVSESCTGCTAGGENNSNWYAISIATSGNLLLTLDPTVNTDDYDFAIYGPGVTCATLGAPIRCSYAATANPGNTGMGNGALDLSEDVTGNSWVAPLAVTAGQVYYIMINKWDPTPGSGFTLRWTGGVGGNSTASLDCTPLPVQLTSFTCEPFHNEIDIHWSTAAELNSNYFIVEKSTDGDNYIQMMRVEAQGFSNQVTEYIAADVQPSLGENYYRLTQVDFDGKEKVYAPITCSYGSNLPTIIEVNIFDLNGKFILSEFENTKDLQSIVNHLTLKPGMYILYTTYSDGSTQMRKFVKI